MGETDNICFWYDGNDFRLTRCIMDSVAKRPIGFPNDVNASINLIIEFERGHEPLFYNDDGTEIGIENTF